MVTVAPPPTCCLYNVTYSCSPLSHTHTVTKEETERLLCKYRGITGDRVDRTKFRDLLHDHFAMSDDFFMDRGR